MMAMSRRIVSAVSAGKPRIYPANVRIPCARQASSILRYSVILFWRFLGSKIVGIDVLEPDEDPGDAGAFGLFDEIRDTMTQCVHLDHEPERDAALAQLDQAIKDRFPILVPREVVVGDEELVNAVGPIQAHEALDIVGRAVTRLASLDIDDRAERALIRTTASRIERRT